MDSNKSINIENLKDFIKNILPKYITNKDVLDKLSIDSDANLKYNGTFITKIDDTLLSDNTTYSSNK